MAEKRAASAKMTIEEMQQSIDRWIQDIGHGYFPPLANMAVLTEEVGELARVVVRKYGPQVPKKGDLDKDMKEELADVLWVVGCLANQTGVNLAEAFRKALEKKTLRDRHRFDRSNPGCPDISDNSYISDNSDNSNTPDKI